MFRTGLTVMSPYPAALSVLAPCAVPQELPEALQLSAAPDRAAGPHFTLQPAGGRQVPPQHGVAVVHLTPAKGQGHLLPHVLDEIWKEETGNITTHLGSQFSACHSLLPELLKGQLLRRRRARSPSFHT